MSSVNEYVDDRVAKIVFIKSGMVRSLNMFLALKIFEVKRKGARDIVLTSNILFVNIWRTRVSQT